MTKKIKSLISYTYDFQQFGVLRAQEFRKYIDSEEFFDEQGNVIEQIKYTQDGREEEKVINRYDEQNRLIMQERLFIINGTAERIEIYHNDGLGITEEKKYYDDEPGEKAIVKRNSHGDITEQIEYDEDEAQISRTNYTYFDKGLVSEECLYDENERMVKRVINTYNKEKKLVEQRVEFPEEDDRGYTLKIDYPEPLKQKGLAVYEHGEIKFETLDIFDQKGREIEAHYIDPENPDECWQLRRAYNDKGQLLYREQYNGDNVLVFRNDYEYENDMLKADLLYRFNPWNASAIKHRTVYEYTFYETED